MSDDTVSDQSVSLTDQTVEETGVAPDVPMVPTDDPAQDTEEETTDEGEHTAEGKQRRLEEKKEKISQKEWQEMMEKSKGFDEFKENLAKAMGITEEEVEGSEDLMSKMQTQIETLKKDNERKDWEVENPIVRDEKYKDAWKEVNSNEKYAALSYEERFKLIRDPGDVISAKKAESELKEQELGLGSVPPASKSAPSGDDIDPEVFKMLKGRFGNRLSDKEIRAMARE